MKIILMFVLMVSGIIAHAQINTITPGTVAPAFNLPDVDGEKISFASFPEAKGYIVVFTCNTCPVSKAYEQKIIDLNTRYKKMGFHVIAINPNDPQVSSGDDFESMKKLAKNKNYQFPYLYDKGQVTTNAYGARTTPHIFLVEKKNNTHTVVYTGAIDNDPQNEKSSRENYLENAITAVAEGKTPPLESTKSIGCTVKRKKSDL